MGDDVDSEVRILVEDVEEGVSTGIVRRRKKQGMVDGQLQQKGELTWPLRRHNTSLASQRWVYLPSSQPSDLPTCPVQPFSHDVESSRASDCRNQSSPRQTQSDARSVPTALEDDLDEEGCRSEGDLGREGQCRDQGSELRWEEGRTYGECCRDELQRERGRGGSRVGGRELAEVPA